MKKKSIYFFKKFKFLCFIETSSRYKPYRRYQRHRGFEQNPLSDPDQIDSRIYWTDFENTILYQTSRKDEHTDANELRQNLLNYKEAVEEKYKGNPVMISRMILVYLKVIAVLDRRATIEYPLLKKHRSGINSAIIASLLLPQRADMETALHLEKYFRMRDETAQHPSLIEEKNVSDKSFSVNCARENEEMNELRDTILELDKANVQRQKEKWTEGRETVGRIRDNANRLRCTFITDRHGDVHHDRRCRRCQLNREALKVGLLGRNQNDQFG